MRIGELARTAGTTPRTVRYYEEIGLLAASGDRSAGAHREYGEAARARRRREWHETDDPAERRRILHEGKAHTDALLELVRRRRADLEGFEAELNERRQQQVHLLRELGE